VAGAAACHRRRCLRWTGLAHGAVVGVVEPELRAGGVQIDFLDYDWSLNGS
jgi:hypothetical protein